MTHTRWWMLSLLFFATTINYLDRNVIATLALPIREDLKLSIQEFGYILSAFQAMYMVGFLFAGQFIDRMGVRIGYGLAALWWTAAAALTTTAANGLQLGFWRGLLGLGEAGNFPAAIKAVGEWFPVKDRAFAVGVFNAGTNVASMAGPPLFAWLTETYGWRTCFLATSATGVVWLVVWWVTYKRPEEHPAVNAAELAYIRGGAPAVEVPKIGWSEALRYRETWGFAAGKFFSDPVWWFYINWLPSYLQDVRGFDLKQAAWAVPVIYLVADFGSVFGGWISGWMIRRGVPMATARKIAMGCSAACMPIAATCVLANESWLAIALVSLAAAAHQAWSANLFAVAPDLFPPGAVASVTGIGGCAGALGGMLFSGAGAGWIISHFGYPPAFLMMGGFHITGFLLVRWLCGGFRPVQPKGVAA